MDKRNTPLRILKRNTVLTIGIIVCSLFTGFHSLAQVSIQAQGQETGKILSEVKTGTRSYELQFFTTRIHNRLDFSRLMQIGINKIIFRVFQDTQRNGGLYFNNTQFKTLEPSLEKLETEFGAGKPDLCAWMITRKFNWTNDHMLMDYQYENGQRQLIPKLDIFNPDAVQKIIAVYKDLASNRINAILIQDDFFLRYNEGFSSWGKAQFAAVAGFPAREKLMMQKNTPYNRSWNRVKAKQVEKVLALIVKNSKMVNTSIKVGMNVYYETPVYPGKSKAWYSHDLEGILQSGVDYIYLMSYHRQIKNEMKLSESANRLFFKEIVDKAYEICGDKLIVKIQLRDWKTGHRIPSSEVKEYLALIPPQVKRVCFTPVKVNDYDYLHEIIGGVTAKMVKATEEKETKEQF